MNGLVLQLSDDGKTLQAVCTPAEKDVDINDSDLRKALEKGGFSNFFFFNNACTGLVSRFNASPEPFTVDLGERRDGTISLSVTADLMTVNLTITPPYGGNAVTKEQIYRSLKEMGITNGIQDEAIEKAATACRALNKLVAVGRPPVPGENGQFISLIPEMKERCPHQDDDCSIVDYRELGGIISVRPGDPLMRRVPPTEGIPGENVKGGAVSALSGAEVTFAQGLTGVIPSPDDSDLLVAAIAGQPVLVTNGVIVEPTVKMKNVDLSTGNISFEGTLVIAGDIAPGMTVKATGDIVVGGTVESAVLEAGGNVEIRGGVIFSQIHAKGSFTALFAERSHIHVGRDIALRELSMLSELKAGGQVAIGEEGTKKGHIIGGMCRAATAVRTLVAGSHAGVPTRIEVGADPDSREKLLLVRQQLEDKNKEAEEVCKALAYLQGNVSRLDREAILLKEKSRSALEAEIKELTMQEKRLQRRMETVENARIQILGTIFYGVQLVIGDKSLIVDDDFEAVTFRIEDGVIVH